MDQYGTDPAALEGLMAGGAVISLVLMVLLGVFFVVLGVLVPWFVWRTKVYTKKSYLLMRDWARWEQGRR